MIVVNDVQYLKAYNYIVFIEYGNYSVLMLVQFSNALSPIFVNVFDKIIVWIFTQFLNELLPIIYIELGKFSDVIV